MHSRGRRDRSSRPPSRATCTTSTSRPCARGLRTGVAEAARSGRTGNPLVALGSHWAVRLTTFRRDGTPVSTPVNVAVEGDRAVFRTYEQAGKFKRLRNDPRVEVAPG